MTTWHVSPALADGITSGRIAFAPLRNAHVPAFLQRSKIDVAFVRTSPPDRNGFCSLGPSASYPLPLVSSARFVIAEVSDDVPRTLGHSSVHRQEIDLFVDSDSPPREYAAAVPSPTAELIAQNVMEILPPQPTVQLGIGEIPEAITGLLADFDAGPLRFVGMGSDRMVDLFEYGRLDLDSMKKTAAITAVELMGTRKLMTFADGNPAVGVYPISESANPQVLSDIERFVSVNSAFQVDLLGQVNAEWLGRGQRSGIGGSVDFVESALASPGGVQIIALRSTTRDGRRSRIVPHFSQGTPVTVPRHSVQFVVTEYGTADLRRGSMMDRAEQLLTVAHPDYRDELAEALPGAVGQAPP